MPEHSRTVVSLRDFFFHVYYVVLKQGCCGTYQYNLPDRMLRNDFNTTLNQSYVILITVVNLAYQSRGLVSSIYPFLVYLSMKGVICPHCFYHFFHCQFLTFPFSVCDVNNKKNISLRVYRTNQLVKSSLVLLLFSPCYSIL